MTIGEGIAVAAGPLAMAIMIVGIALASRPRR